MASFITKLKGSVTDDSLERLGCIRFRINGTGNHYLRLQRISAQQFAKGGILCRCSGDMVMTTTGQTHQNEEFLANSGSFPDNTSVQFSLAGTYAGGYVDVHIPEDANTIGLVFTAVGLDCSFDFSRMYAYAPSMIFALLSDDSPNTLFRTEQKMSDWLAMMAQNPTYVPMVKKIGNNGTNVIGDIPNASALADYIGITVMAVRNDVELDLDELAAGQVANGRTSGTIRCYYSGASRLITFDPNESGGYKITNL